MQLGGASFEDITKGAFAPTGAGSSGEVSHCCGEETCHRSLFW